MDKVFFTLGGAEAIENAIKLARHYTGRYKVLAATAPITAPRWER